MVKYSKEPDSAVKSAKARGSSLRVHFKQMRSGEAIPSVNEGDLDCLRMRDLLNAKGYAGAAIMEIPSDAAVFDNLESSFQYLDS